MSLNIDRLAEQIATLDRAEQEALFKKVAELTFQVFSAEGALRAVGELAETTKK